MGLECRAVEGDDTARDETRLPSRFSVECTQGRADSQNRQNGLDGLDGLDGVVEGWAVEKQTRIDEPRAGLAGLALDETRFGNGTV